MEGSTLEVADPTTHGAQRKWCVLLKLGPQFGDRGDPHILAAPSKQSLEEWVDKFTTASKTHKSILAQLHKSRRMACELQAQLSQSPKYVKFLANAQGKEAKALQIASEKVKGELLIVHEKALVAIAKANKYEGDAMRALTLWSLLTQCLAGNRDVVLEIIARLQVELDLTTKLCELLESKAGFLQGQGIEKLDEDGRIALSYLCEKALNNVLHKLARIRVKAPRYTNDVNPVIFPEHDFQFNHNSEIYDLYMDLKKSARKKIVVDLEARTVDKMLRTSGITAVATVVSSGLGAFRSIALQASMAAAVGIHMARVGKPFGKQILGPSTTIFPTSHQEVVDNPNDSIEEDTDEEI